MAEKCKTRLAYSIYRLLIKVRYCGDLYPEGKARRMQITIL